MNYGYDGIGTTYIVFQLPEDAVPELELSSERNPEVEEVFREVLADLSEENEKIIEEPDFDHTYAWAYYRKPDSRNRENTILLYMPSNQKIYCIERQWDREPLLEEA